MIKLNVVKPKKPLRPRKVDIPVRASRTPITIAERIVAIKQRIEHLRNQKFW